ARGAPAARAGPADGRSTPGGAQRAAARRMGREREGRRPVSGAVVKRHEPPRVDHPHARHAPRHPAPGARRQHGRGRAGGECCGARLAGAAPNL
ncbi:MAG: hypothetical protein AVDCRST_MAG67-2462, partial [uncultured Solirubrobacteraceae bacterium]